MFGVALDPAGLTVDPVRTAELRKARRPGGAGIRGRIGRSPVVMI
jgi:hypothetical protein